MTSQGDPGEAELRRRLRALRVEPKDAGFTTHLHARLAQENPPAPAPGEWLRGVAGRILSPALGVAAGVAAFALLTLLRGAAPTGGAAVRVPASQVALVHLNLSAEVAVAAADIRVILPDGLVFWVDGAALVERSVEWRQPLHPGNNEIPIAIRGQRPGRYHLTVSALAGGERIEHDVVLEVTGT